MEAYEAHHDFPPGTHATLDQVIQSSAGVERWARSWKPYMADRSTAPEQATPAVRGRMPPHTAPHGNGRSAFTALSSADSQAQSKRNGYRPKCLDRSLKASQKHTARGVQAWTLWVWHIFSHTSFSPCESSISTVIYGSPDVHLLCTLVYLYGGGLPSLFM